MIRNQVTNIRKSAFSLLFLALLIAPVCYSCKPAILPNSSNNQPATLVFGQGGGVTGKYTEYTLVSDRNLYRNNLETGEKTFLKKIDKSTSRQFFLDAESMRLLTLQFNAPYNINFYIIFIKGVKQNKINWGNAQSPPPARVKDLWEKLWALTK